MGSVTKSTNLVPVGLLELVFVEFTGLVPWQLVVKVDALRTLKMGESVATELHECLFIDTRTTDQFYRRLDRFAELLIRDTEDGCVLNFLVHQQDIFHFSWVDVDAAADDHV